MTLFPNPNTTVERNNFYGKQVLWHFWLPLLKNDIHSTVALSSIRVADIHVQNDMYGMHMSDLVQVMLTSASTKAFYIVLSERQLNNYR